MPFKPGDKVIYQQRWAGIDFRVAEVERVTPKFVFVKTRYQPFRVDKAYCVPFSESLWQQLQEFMEQEVTARKAQRERQAYILEAFYAASEQEETR